MHERQAVVFGLLIATLALAGVGALAILSGAVSAPFDRPIASPSSTDTALLTSAACLPKNTRPVAYSKVTVNVYNASDRSGIARATADALAQRGFAVHTVGNSTVDVAAPRIVYGAKGLAQAYTLAAHVPDARLVLDTRKDAGVDLVLGTAYTSLTPVKEVGLSPKKAMASVGGCVALKDVKAVPAGSSVPKPKATAGSAKK